MSNVQVTWTGPGLRMVGDVDNGPAILLDSDHPEYGTHSGPSPMELILLGLAGCTAMDVITIMEKKRQPLTNLQIKVTAEERADTHPMVYTKIRLEYIAYGGVDEAALARAIELSEEKYCSVNAMLSKTAEITTTYRIVADAHPGKPGVIVSDGK